MVSKPGTSVYFSDVFGVHPDVLAEFGAFDVSLVSDLPLFIDPFLLFTSDRPEYRALHDEIIRYVVFLRERAASGTIARGLLEGWFTFREVKETWLGYSKDGNKGRGLGIDFARALHANLGRVFASFGTEEVTKGSHLEKLCLIADGVGRDSISDFATNLIKPYLISFTERFAKAHLRPDQRKVFAVSKATFNYDTETWSGGRYELPKADSSYVILTPIDMLTKDDVWINKSDLVRDYDHIVAAVSNEQLREQLGRYFQRKLEEIQARDEAKRRAKEEESKKPRSPRARAKARERRDPTQSQTNEAAVVSIKAYPEIIDHYIRFKEDHGDEAQQQAEERVRSSERLFVGQVRDLANYLAENSSFYRAPGDTTEGALHRLHELKRVIETTDAAKFLYFDGRPIDREADFHIIIRNVWCNVPRVHGDNAPIGPQKGCFSRKVVDIRAGSNQRLASLLEDAASDDPMAVIRGAVCFDRAQRAQLSMLRDTLKLHNRPDIVIIDATR
jgi:hypothetical protein